ncbi:MAG: hypoxanthine phosphoribosyltransferase [Dehalococcoidia bacterium]
MVVQPAPAAAEHDDAGLQEGDAEAEGAEPGPRKRRRRGRRGGAKRRQSAEQAVAGIPPLSEPEDAMDAPEEPEEDESPQEQEGHTSAAAPAGIPDRGPRRRGGRTHRAKTAAELSTGPDHSKDISFMHPSEREFAHLLEYYGIKYLYEPRSFPLRWEGERVVQMFTPDFYLPEYDQYFELTTMKQSLVTQKNRKLRQVRELYPDVNVQLLYRRDLMRLMGKYGHGPLSEVSVEGTERVLFTEQQVRDRVKEMGRQITEEYKGREPVLIGVLRGVVVFMADLMREIDLPMQIEFMEISHYGEEREDSIEVIRDAGTDVVGRDVILVEDIVDTGLTLRYLLEHLNAKKPASVKVCALLDKSVRRMADVPIDYVGFEVPDDFVIGYGLDYGGRYRNVRYIGVLKPVEPKAVPQR